MAKLTSERFLNIDPKMIHEIASGVEDGHVIALRYGFTLAEWEELKDISWFIAEVTRVRSEMERTGQTFRLRASVMAQALLDDTFSNAIKADTPVKDKAAALQLFAKIGGLEAPRQEAAAGNGFSITINLPQAPQSSQTIRIKPEVVEDVEAEPLSLGFGDNDEANS